MDGFERLIASDDTAPDTGARTNRRDSLFLAARFRLVGGAENAVRVRNLSEGGVMVELAVPPAHGASVEIEIRGLGWVRGTIAWIAQGRVGIAFDAPIDPLKARTPIGRGIRRG